MDVSLENKMLVAVQAQNVEVVVKLLSKGANPNKTVNNGRTCLGEAAFKGYTEIALKLIAVSHSEKIVYRDDECEPCHCSLKNRKREASVIPVKKKLDMSLFIKSKTDKSVAAKDTDGSSSGGGKELTPISPQADLEWDENIGEAAESTKEDELMVAMYKWYASILESTGAAVVAASEYTCGIDQEDAFGRTALSYACDENNVEIVKALLDAGCKIDIPGSATGWSVLHSSCAAKSLASIKLLVAAGCNINLRTPMKTTALHIAACHNLELITVLVENGAALNLRDEKDRTALYIAAAQGHPDVVRYLASRGANVNIADQDGHTPLCAAVTYKHVSCVATLFHCGARVAHYQCLLHTAVKQETYQMVKLLANNFIINGLGVNVRNESGETPLLVAVTIDNAESISRLLLQKGANVNICNSQTGVSPLHVAVEFGEDPREFEALLNMLLDYEVDLDRRAATRDTPLNRAILMHKDRIAMQLIRYGANVNLCEVLTDVHGNLIIAGNRKSNKLANMLIKAGHRQVSQHQFNNENKTSLWITEMYKSPLSLANICRLRIRLMPCRITLRDFVKALPLPDTLKNFLLMKELLC